jgi:hypothetical protein
VWQSALLSSLHWLVSPRSALFRFSCCVSLAAQAPELCYIAAMLKLAPVRDAFEEQVELQRRNRRGLQRDARTLHRILVDMLPRVVQESRVLDVWSANCGRRTAYHSGYLRFLGRLGVLQRFDGQGAKGAQVALGQQGNLYSIDRKGLPSTLKAIQGFIVAAEAVRACQLLPCASELIVSLAQSRGVFWHARRHAPRKRDPCVRLRPRTCQQWAECVQLLATQLAGAGAIRAASMDSYTTLWLIRTVLVSPTQCLHECTFHPRARSESRAAGRDGPRSEMRAAGVERLLLVGPSGGPLAAAERVQQFSATVPDQHSHLAAFANACRAADLGSLSVALQYTGPPELLSMECCLFLARGTIVGNT